MAAKHQTKPAVENIPNGDTKVKDKALDGAITQIERQYGKGSIMRLGEGASRAEIEDEMMPLEAWKKELGIDGDQ